MDEELIQVDLELVYKKKKKKKKLDEVEMSK